MDIIDEKGRVFGVVNVVDALVVLVVLALIVAGVALVTGGTGEEPGSGTEPQPTRYATVSFEVPHGSDAATLAPDDTLSVIEGSESFAVRDVYRSFTPDGAVHVVATIGSEGSLTVDESPIYGGDTVGMTTGSYRVDADVLTVNRTSGEIPTTSRQVVLTTNVTGTVANAIDSGDTATIGDTEVASVTGVDRRETESGERRVLVGLELTVWDSEPVPAFDGSSLRVGNQVTVVTDHVTIPGRVAAVGTDDPGDVSSG